MSPSDILPVALFGPRLSVKRYVFAAKLTWQLETSHGVTAFADSLQNNRSSATR